MTDCLINGVKADYLSVDDRSIQYGDGLFETLPCVAGHLYYWPQHYARLQASCHRLKISCPDEAMILADIKQLEESVDYASAEQVLVIKVIISRGTGGRGYQFSNKQQPVRLVSASIIDNGYSSLFSSGLQHGNLHLCQQPVSINPALAGMKHLNRLDNVMARSEWHDRAGGIIDGVMCDATGDVIECTSCNLFAVDEDGRVYTPDLSSAGVDGIMRNVILELCQKCGVKTEVRTFDVDQLKSMREVFISNSLIGMKSVDQFDGSSFATNEVTATIFDQMIATLDMNRYALV